MVNDTTLTKGLKWEYIGVKDGHNLPPYLFGEDTIGLIFTGDRSISGSTLLTYKYGTTNWPADDIYLFKMLEESESRFGDNLINKDLIKEYFGKKHILKKSS